MNTIFLGTGKSGHATWIQKVSCVALLLIGLLFCTALTAAAGKSSQSTTERVSIGMAGAQSNGDSTESTISNKGRYVAFSSIADNLVNDDTNGTKDVFVYDRVTGATEMDSVSSTGAHGNYWSMSPQISADGRYVAFSSNATNLVAGNPNAYDIYVRDRKNGQTLRASVDSSGIQGNADSGSPAISANGRYVAFDSQATNLDSSDTNATWDVYVRDLVGKKTIWASVDSSGKGGNNTSIRPNVSADGQFVVFWSQATNLVPNDTNIGFDVFVRDIKNGITERVNVNSAGAQVNGDPTVGRMPSISGDGRYVVFASAATNLVSNDTNGARDVFVHDRKTGQTLRVSVASNGTQANGDSSEPRISGNGRYVVFQSVASNLVSNDTNGALDIFYHELETGKTMRVSVPNEGLQANGDSTAAAISPDGQYISFTSFASNLVSKDTNGAWDIFVHTIGVPGVPVLVSPADKELLTTYLPKLDWNEAATAQHYQVQVSKSRSFSNPVLNEDDVTASEYTFTTALPANSTWYWHVRSFDDLDMASAWSAVRTFRTKISPPTPISPVGGVTVTDLRPTFKWNKPRGTTGYIFQVSTDSSFGSFVINVTIKKASPSYKPATDLPGATTLYWRVQATGKNGPSDWMDYATFKTP